MSDKQECVVTVSPSRPLAEVAKELTRAGFLIDQKLAQIGVITGTCPAGSLKKFRGIMGVIDVSPSTGIDVGPPDFPVS